MENCIFCKIVKGEFDSAKIWEDDKHLAILDIMPNTKGMTLILTKKHYDSYAFGMDDKVYSDLMNLDEPKKPTLTLEQISRLTEGRVKQEANKKWDGKYKKNNQL